MITTTKAASAATGTAKEFRDFILRGNVVDLAVGVIIGGAFGGIVTALVKDVIKMSSRRLSVCSVR